MHDCKCLKAQLHQAGACNVKHDQTESHEGNEGGYIKSWPSPQHREDKTYEAGGCSDKMLGISNRGQNRPIQMF